MTSLSSWIVGAKSGRVSPLFARAASVSLVECLLLWARDAYWLHGVPYMGMHVCKQRAFPGPQTKKSRYAETAVTVRLRETEEEQEKV